MRWEISNDLVAVAAVGMDRATQMGWTRIADLVRARDLVGSNCTRSLRLERGGRLLPQEARAKRVGRSRDVRCAAVRRTVSARLGARRMLADLGRGRTVIPTSKNAGTARFGFARFGTVAGVLAGLTAGVGITVLHSARPALALAPPVASASPSALPSAAGSATPTPTLEQQIAEHEQVRRDAIARHEREPRDPEWSAATEKHITALLATLAAPGKFRVSSVDCRTTSCVAYLRVATYLDAQKAWPSSVQAQNDAQCGTEITLLPPQAGAAFYEFSAVYNCIRAAKLQLAEDRLRLR